MSLSLTKPKSQRSNSFSIILTEASSDSQSRRPVPSLAAGQHLMRCAGSFITLERDRIRAEHCVHQCRSSYCRNWSDSTTLAQQTGSKPTRDDRLHPAARSSGSGRWAPQDPSALDQNSRSALDDREREDVPPALFHQRLVVVDRDRARPSVQSHPGERGRERLPIRGVFPGEQQGAERVARVDQRIAGERQQVRGLCCLQPRPNTGRTVPELRDRRELLEHPQELLPRDGRARQDLAVGFGLRTDR